MGEKIYGLIFLTALVVFLLDRAAKIAVTKLMSLNQEIIVIKKLLSIFYVHNFGAGFGILQNWYLFFIGFALIVIIVILKFYNKIPQRKKALQLAVGLLLGGTLARSVFEGQRKWCRFFKVERKSAIKTISTTRNGMGVK